MIEITHITGERDGRFAVKPKHTGNTAALGADVADEGSLPLAIEDGETMEATVTDEEGVETAVTYTRRGDSLTAVSRTDAARDTVSSVFTPGYDVQGYREGFTEHVDALLARSGVSLSDTKQFVQHGGYQVQADFTSTMPADTPRADVEAAVIERQRQGTEQMNAAHERIAMWNTHSFLAEQTMKRHPDMVASEAWKRRQREDDGSTLRDLDAEERKRLGGAVANNLEYHDEMLRSIVADQNRQGNPLDINIVRERFIESIVVLNTDSGQYERNLDGLYEAENIRKRQT